MSIAQAVTRLTRSDIEPHQAVEILASLEQTHGRPARERAWTMWRAHPVDAASAVAQAAVLVDQLQTVAAVELLEAAHEAWPSSAPVITALASLYARRCDLGSAIALCEQWTKTAPGEAEAWFTLGYYLSAAGRLEEAMDALQACVDGEGDLGLYRPAVSNLYQVKHLVGQPAGGLLDLLPDERYLRCYRTCGILRA